MFTKMRENMNFDANQGTFGRNLGGLIHYIPTTLETAQPTFQNEPISGLIGYFLFISASL